MSVPGDSYRGSSRCSPSRAYAPSSPKSLSTYTSTPTLRNLAYLSTVQPSPLAPPFHPPHNSAPVEGTLHADGPTQPEALVKSSLPHRILNFFNNLISHPEKRAEDSPLLSDYDLEGADAPPPPPLLPLPSPDAPTPSFYQFSSRSVSELPITSRRAYHKRRLVVRNVDFMQPVPPATPEMEQDPQAMRRRQQIIQRNNQRYEAFYRWCQMKGEVIGMKVGPGDMVVVSWRTWAQAYQVCLPFYP